MHDEVMNELSFAYKLKHGFVLADFRENVHVRSLGLRLFDGSSYIAIRGNILEGWCGYGES